MRLYGQLGAPLVDFLLAYSGLPLPLKNVTDPRERRGGKGGELRLVK
jgi:hypothetical protein